MVDINCFQAVFDIQFSSIPDVASVSSIISYTYMSFLILLLRFYLMIVMMMMVMMRIMIILL